MCQGHVILSLDGKVARIFATFIQLWLKVVSNDYTSG